MYDVIVEPSKDCVLVHFTDAPVLFTEELGYGRMVSYAGKYEPIGVLLRDVSRGVISDDLPREEAIVRTLQALNIPVSRLIDAVGRVVLEAVASEAKSANYISALLVERGFKDSDFRNVVWFLVESGEVEFTSSWLLQKVESGS